MLALLHDAGCMKLLLLLQERRWGCERRRGRMLSQDSHRATRVMKHDGGRRRWESGRWWQDHQRGARVGSRVVQSDALVEGRRNELRLL